MRARGGERSFGTWLSGLVGSASTSSGGGGTDEPRTAVCDDEIDDRWVEDGRPPPEATAPARTKAKPRYSSPTPPRERSRSPWYRRGEGAKVIRPAKSGAPEVGARAAWPSLAVLPPWFRRWRRPIAQRPGAAAAYEEALLAEPERPHWLWTPSPEPTTPPEPLSTTEKLLRQGNPLLEPRLETPNRLHSTHLSLDQRCRRPPREPPELVKSLSRECQDGATTLVGAAWTTRRSRYFGAASPECRITWSTSASAA